MQDNRPSWFNPQISAGTVVQLIAFVVLISLAWGTLRAEQTAQDKRLSAIEESSSQREARVRAVEISQAGTASDVRSIQAGISRIENLLDQLAKRQ